jgi:N-acetylmuramoyl-L-alanine amidase
MLLLLLSACAPPPAAVEPPAPPPEVVVVAAPPPWPMPGAPLRSPVASWPEGASFALYVDGGHGAPGNPGMQAVSCADEQDLTQRYVDALVERLADSPPLTVARSRGEDGAVGYDDRIRAAEALDADLMLSLHVDSRAGIDPAYLDPVTGCAGQDGAEGFSVLWSDEGSDEELIARRQELANALARRLAEAGFTPYDGWAYASLYAGDPENPGVFVDRHDQGKRIRVLRRPKVPSVIVETHHGRDPDEHARWEEPATWDAFAAAVEAALADVSASAASSPPAASAASSSEAPPAW